MRRISMKWKRDSNFFLRESVVSIILFLAALLIRLKRMFLTF